jgi:hypothetical protein
MRSLGRLGAATVMALVVGAVGLGASASASGPPRSQQNSWLGVVAGYSANIPVTSVRTTVTVPKARCYRDLRTLELSAAIGTGKRGAFGTVVAGLCVNGKPFDQAFAGVGVAATSNGPTLDVKPGERVTLIERDQHGKLTSIVIQGKRRVSTSTTWHASSLFEVGAFRLGARLAGSGPLHFTDTTINGKAVSDIAGLTSTDQIHHKTVILRVGKLQHKESFAVTQP